MESINLLQWVFLLITGLKHLDVAGASVACGINANDHSDCPIDQYCGYGRSRQTYCMDCYNCYYSDDDPVDLFEAISPCPAKCFCESHVDCDSGSFCDKNYGSGRPKVCTKCEYCHLEEQDCASICSCSTSEDCGEGSFCLQDFNFQNPLGQGICTNCFEGSCIEENLFDQSESCQNLCPAQYECSEHRDCGTEGQWCSKDHKCHQCSEDCWSIFGVSAYRGAPFWYELEGISIDFTCPEDCCDWGMDFDLNSEWDTRSYFKVGPCNPNLQIEAYFTGASYPRWTPFEFQQYGHECRVDRYEVENGYPQVVTIVDCSAVGWADHHNCRQDVTATLALLAIDEATNTTTFLDEDSFPHTAYYGHGCYNEQSLPSSGGLFIILFIILFVLLCPCMCAICRVKRRNGHRSTSGRHSAGTVTMAVQATQEQAPSVPRASVIDAMFPTQHRSTEKTEDDNDDNQCTICLLDIEPGDTILTGGSCDHYYHRDCITQWLKCKEGNDHCPNCRSPMWTTEAYALTESTLLSSSTSPTSRKSNASRSDRSSSRRSNPSTHPDSMRNIASNDSEATSRNPTSRNSVTDHSRAVAITESAESNVPDGLGNSSSSDGVTTEDSDETEPSRDSSMSAGDHDFESAPARTSTPEQ